GARKALSHRAPDPSTARRMTHRDRSTSLGPETTFETEEHRMAQVVEDGGRTDRATIAARAVDAVKVYGAGLAAARALDGITIEFPARHFNAIMGPSGSGKSTLLHCMAGLDSLTSGQAFIGEVELGRL